MPEQKKHLNFTLFIFLIIVFPIFSSAQEYESIEVGGFWDSAHHWRDINDSKKTIYPSPNQKTYKKNEITKIADNILLYQKDNGGWPKNYDMLAILTEDQKQALKDSKEETNTTFDNGATHSQIYYLSRVYAATGIKKYADACVNGLEFILRAQYPNGGWPQFYPDTSGYRKYITFNDGAMSGIMMLLQDIVNNPDNYPFIENELRKRIDSAYEKGIECILKCQITDEGKLKAWCQQHDNVDYHPQNARTFEPAAVCTEESVGILYALMNVKEPDSRIVNSINSAIAWLNESQLHGIRVKMIEAPHEEYNFHSTDSDRVVVEDPDAPPIWSRYYELRTNKPLFCNRDGKTVYSLAEVHRERRTGYSWYGYWPSVIIEYYKKWQMKWSPDKNVLN